MRKLNALTVRERQHNAERAREYRRSENGRAASKRANRKQHLHRRALLDSFKRVPCMDCGGVFPSCCMDFDHRPGETKLFAVGTAVSGRSVPVILAEIAKCDVVCANCHRIRTIKVRKQHLTNPQPRRQERPQLALGLSKPEAA